MPSIVTESVTEGNADSGEMVCTPEPAMSNVMVSATPADAFDAKIAARRVPAPESPVLVTGITASSVRVSSRLDRRASGVVAGPTSGDGGPAGPKVRPAHNQILLKQRANARTAWVYFGW